MDPGRRRRWILTVAAIALVLAGIAAVFVVRSGPRDEAQLLLTPPLGIVNVISADRGDDHGGDLYLVELGRPPSDGIRIRRGASFVPVTELAWRQVGGSNSTFGLAPGIVALDDHRVLLAYAIPAEGSFGDHDSELDAVVVDLATGDVLPVLRDTGSVAVGRMDTPRWDPLDEQLVYAVDDPTAEAFPESFTCFQFEAAAPGSGFEPAPCTPANQVAPPDQENRRGAAWRHEPSGRVLATTMPRPGGQAGITSLWSLEPGGDEAEEIIGGYRLLLLDVSADGRTVLTLRDERCDDGSPLCHALETTRDGVTTLIATESSMWGASLEPDGAAVIYSVSTSTDGHDYPHLTYRVTVAAPHRRELLHDGVLEAVLPRSHGLVPLADCPVEIPCVPDAAAEQG